MNIETLISESPSKLSTETKKRLDQKLKSLESLLHSDVKEQKDTFTFLQQAIDEDRPSHRQRFSPS